MLGWLIAHDGSVGMKCVGIDRGSAKVSNANVGTAAEKAM